MNAVEFTAELAGTDVLRIPPNAFAQLPKVGRARVIVLTGDDSDGKEWQQGAYEQFLREIRPKMPSTKLFADMLGEIFLCQFPFTSGVGSKVRPALVLFDLGQDAIICRITSVVRNGPLDVTLKGWKAAGLLLPSVARLDRIITAERSIFLRRLGILSNADVEAIRIVWNQHMIL